MPVWDWWLWTDAGLATRVAIGAGIFAVLAGVDLWRNGRRATRWREYLFLLAAVILAMAYGLANDYIASGISWEYFYYGKGLDHVLGPHVPPDPAALARSACAVGLRATWSAGLIVGVVLLIANNPRPGRPQLPYRKLLILLPAIFAGAAVIAVLGAWVGAMGWLAWTNADIGSLVRENLFRPKRFMSVYGLNLGGYAGGLLATVAAAIYIRRHRRREP